MSAHCIVPIEGILYCQQVVDQPGNSWLTDLITANPSSAAQGCAPPKPQHAAETLPCDRPGSHKPQGDFLQENDNTRSGVLGCQSLRKGSRDAVVSENGDIRSDALAQGFAGPLTGSGDASGGSGKGRGLGPEGLGCAGSDHVYEITLALVTGRTHQIRAQFAAAGAPIIGDVMYEPLEGFLLPREGIAGAEFVARVEASSQVHGPIGLHAARLSWGTRVFEASPPWA